MGLGQSRLPGSPQPLAGLIDSGKLFNPLVKWEKWHPPCKVSGGLNKIMQIAALIAGFLFWCWWSIWLFLKGANVGAEDHKWIVKVPWIAPWEVKQADGECSAAWAWFLRAPFSTWLQLSSYFLNSYLLNSILHLKIEDAIQGMPGPQDIRCVRMD